eukprot:2073465-Pyramimonas_sp.AAC.1
MLRVGGFRHGRPAAALLQSPVDHRSRCPPSSLRLAIADQREGAVEAASEGLHGRPLRAGLRGDRRPRPEEVKPEQACVRGAVHMPPWKVNGEAQGRGVCDRALKENRRGLRDARGRLPRTSGGSHR